MIKSTLSRFTQAVVENLRNLTVEFMKTGIVGVTGDVNLLSYLKTGTVGRTCGVNQD